MTFVSLGHDPLSYLRDALRTRGEVFRVPGKLVVVAEAELAKAVLDNSGGLYHDHSDFFATRRGVFGPRHAQLKVAQGAKQMLQQEISSLNSSLVPEIARWPCTTEWPDAANLLIHRIFAPMVGPPELRSTVDGVVRRAVLAGARGPSWSPARLLWRRQTMRSLTRAAAGPPAQRPDNLWDVVHAASGEASPQQAAEVFLGLVFALAGSTGFLLAWSLWLLGTGQADAAAAPAAHLVRETLRLWPVAWLLGRRPAHPHNLAGVAVTPGDEVIVCPYLLHRNDRHWAEPDRFQPARWAAGARHPAYLPFGWGTHACAGAGVAMGLVERILTVFISEYQFSVAPQGVKPQIGSALAPPRFTLRLR